MTIIKKISTSLGYNCLFVVWDMEYFMEESPKFHPDNLIKNKEENRSVSSIQSIEYLMFGKYGVYIPVGSLPPDIVKALEEKLLDEVEYNSIEEIKLM